MSDQQFAIQQGEKVGLIALHDAWRQGDLDRPIHLRDDCWVLPEAPLQMQAHWQEWLGTIRAKAIQEATVWLATKAPSAMPGIVNEEDQQLRVRVEHLFYALLITGPVSYEQGFILGGANVAGTSEVRQFSDLLAYRVTKGTRDTSVSLAQVQRAGVMAQGLDAIFGDPGAMRMRAGIAVFLRGLEREYLEARLHQFVRALEGVVKPAIMKSKRQFVDRCQTFSGRSAQHEAILDECYSIRNQVEHLHDWQLGLAHVPEAQREDRLTADQHAIEALCRLVYGRLCESAAHRTLFGDDSIDQFWTRPEHERQQLWGRR